VAGKGAAGAAGGEGARARDRKLTRVAANKNSITHPVIVEKFGPDLLARHPPPPAPSSPRAPPFPGPLFLFFSPFVHRRSPEKKCPMMLSRAPRIGCQRRLSDFPLSLSLSVSVSVSGSPRGDRFVHPSSPASRLRSNAACWAHLYSRSHSCVFVYKLISSV
jgi:hypothetical protein